MQNLASASYNSSFFLDVFGLFARRLCDVRCSSSRLRTRAYRQPASL